MKSFIIMGMMTLSMSANAASLKSLVCENADFKVQVEVSAEKNEPAIVAWSVDNKATEETENFMGYLFTASGDLKQFSSTDLGSDLEVDGATATLTVEDYSTQLSCK
ncbi:hypothetical protein [Bdellovibrio svalbardensis]|uniref:C-type lysozyme inhibitor domain-containing protein n=1 Tax=Bdellovibrio svalbardensis TaxID=2972972 RepID=A0ABT6DHS7_9BACT|nr:hypothetical protein [Bdellovibrio svalbardensis]MDG0815795.1 hypothetical protein [Bdellovibrio svalbardensis]